MAVLPVWLKPLEEDLARVDQAIREALRTDWKPVNQLVDHVCAYGGKRIRPAILLLAGRVVGGCSDEHIKLGAVVEMIHMATLVHDDVIDKAATRRKMATVNAAFGNHTPILLGDVIYAAAFTLTTHLEDRTASRKLAAVTMELCSGEIEQNMTSGRLDLTVDEYMRICEAKTASLLATCGELGAHYAGAPAETVAVFDKYGRSLGIAFQIIDDCLDLEGDEQRVGKSLGTDLEGGKMTLPLIHLYGRLDQAGRDDLRHILEDEGVADRRAALHERFDLAEDVKFAGNRARELVDESLADLRNLREGREREILEQLAKFVVERDL